MVDTEESGKHLSREKKRKQVGGAEMGKCEGSKKKRKEVETEEKKK